MHALDRSLRAIRPFSEVILLILLFGLTLWLRLALPDLITVRRIQAWIVLGPDAWPRFLIDAALMCLLALIIFAVVELRNRLVTGQEEEGVTAQELARWFGVLVLIVAYIWSIRYVGFLLSTFSFGVIYCLITGLRRPKEFIGLPIGFLVVALLLFTQLLSVPLPRGMGMLRAVSYYVY